MFKHQIRIAYRDITLGNHVYYSKYLDFMEIARNELFREMGYPLLKLQEDGFLFPVAECGLRFHAAACYDDLIEVATSVSQLGRAQVTFQYAMRRGPDLLVAAHTRHAVTALNNKPVRMPESLAAGLQKHLESQGL